MSELMEDGARVDGDQEKTGKEESSGRGLGSNSGPNLVVMYTLIAVALAVAIGFAMLIVWPFYQHRH